MDASTYSLWSSVWKAAITNMVIMKNFGVVSNRLHLCGICTMCQCQVFTKIKLHNNNNYISFLEIENNTITTQTLYDLLYTSTWINKFFTSNAVTLGHSQRMERSRMWGCYKFQKTENKTIWVYECVSSRLYIKIFKNFQNIISTSYCT